MSKSKLTKSVVDAYNKRNSNAEDYVLEFERPEIDLVQAALVISKLSGDLSDQANNALMDPESFEYDDITSEILPKLLWYIQHLAHVLDTSIEEISEMDIYPSLEDSDEGKCPHCCHCQDEDKDNDEEVHVDEALQKVIGKIMAKYGVPIEQMRIEIDTKSRTVTVHKETSKK